MIHVGCVTINRENAKRSIWRITRLIGAINKSGNNQMPWTVVNDLYTNFVDLLFASNFGVLSSISGSLTVMGLMLSVLCALIGFMDCQSNFLPEDHITSIRCNIPLLLRKLCLCKMFSIEDAIDTKGTVAKKMKIVKKVQTICETKFKALNDGRLDEFLVYLLINLPFNFMIACYTVVGPSLMAKDDGGPIRSDLAGVWQMGSPVAVEMVNLPTTFLAVLLNMNLFVSLKFLSLIACHCFAFLLNVHCFFFFLVTPFNRLLHS
jgi:hypothetical protein